jgi:hypothetical protein
MKLRGLTRILTAASVAVHADMCPSDVFDHDATYFLAEAIRGLAHDLDGGPDAEGER